MSCSLRDAVLLEARGVPTVILVNDVFEPIARATAALLGMPDEQLARTIVWLPHPTSNLPPAAAEALIDDRIDAIRDALLGRTAIAAVSPAPHTGSACDALAIARDAVGALAASLRADGAELALDAYAGGVLGGVVRIADPACGDGSCIMPADVLARMIEALVRPHLADLVRVQLTEETSFVS